MTFGEKLREFRKRKGWSQKKLSAKSGIHQQTISAYERGDFMPTITTLEWLVVALETTSTELLGF